MSDSGQAVFLSYASQDAEAARRLCEALRAGGVEVWFDQSELVGGDAWDAKIRKQIQACALFVPIISAHTQAREEGYFRREWNLAANRTLDMAHDKAFLLPVVIDGTTDAAARVPDKFREVQWTRLSGGVATAAFVARVGRLLGLAGVGDPGLFAKEVATTEPASARPTINRRDEGVASPEKAKPRGLPRWAVGVLGVVALAVVMFLAQRPIAKPSSVPAATKPPSDLAAKSDAKSIAVLPFKNLNDDKEGGYFSSGVSEELLNLLARVPGLKVCASTSSFRFKDKDTSIADFARQLNVAYVVEGSVRIYDKRVRITAKLIKAADGYTVWSSPNLDRELKDVLGVQDEIARIIADNLQLTLSAPLRAAQTVNPDAHRLFLEGRHFLATRWEGFARAENAFAQAVGIDPAFAPAHDGVAEVASLRGLYQLVDGRGPVSDDFVRAEVAVRRAIELDPSLAEPHATYGLLCFIQRRLGESERYFQGAFARNPNLAVAYHWHGLLLGVVGRFDRALAVLEKSVELDPLGHASLFTYGSYLHAVHRFDESLVALDRAIAIHPTMPPYHAARAATLLRLNRAEDAMAAARRVRKFPRGPSDPPHWWSDGDAIEVLCRGGSKQEAEDFVGELRASLPANSHVVGYALCAIGRPDEGLPMLESVEPMCQTRLYFMSTFDPLQGALPFRQLFAKLNATTEYRTAQETLAQLRSRGARR